MKDDSGVLKKRNDENEEKSVALKYFTWLLNEPMWEVFQFATMCFLSFMSTINFWRSGSEDEKCSDEQRFEEIHSDSSSDEEETYKKN